MKRTIDRCSDVGTMRVSACVQEDPKELNTDSKLKGSFRYFPQTGGTGIYISSFIFNIGQEQVLLSQRALNFHLHPSLLPIGQRPANSEGSWTSFFTVFLLESIPKYIMCTHPPTIPHYHNYNGQTYHVHISPPHYHYYHGQTYHVHTSHHSTLPQL